LRYYDEIGLIESLGVVASGGSSVRGADPDALIQLGKSAGFSLEEMKGMIGKDGVPAIPRNAFSAREDALEVQIDKLMTLARALRHVAGCKAESHMQCRVLKASQGRI
jgi:hypothetical protein